MVSMQPAETITGTEQKNAAAVCNYYREISLAIRQPSSSNGRYTCEIYPILLPALFINSAGIRVCRSHYYSSSFFWSSRG